MKIKVITLGMVLLATTGTTWSADSEDIIKYRNSVMKAYAGHTGAAARIVRGKVDYTDQLLMHATAMRDISMLVGKLFPEDSDIPLDRIEFPETIVQAPGKKLYPLFKRGHISTRGPSTTLLTVNDISMTAQTLGVHFLAAFRTAHRLVGLRHNNTSHLMSTHVTRPTEKIAMHALNI